VMRFEDATVLVVADGSGGMSGGAEAAEDALREILKAARTNGLLEQASWISVLADADDQLSRRTGQCAVVAAALIGDRIVGASAGDCGAWLVGVNGIDDLTAARARSRARSSTTPHIGPRAPRFVAHSMSMMFRHDPGPLALGREYLKPC
jgi:serine/threonine protein phosphatase PrpC